MDYVRQWKIFICQRKKSLFLDLCRSHNHWVFALSHGRGKGCQKHFLIVLALSVTRFRGHKWILVLGKTSKAERGKNYLLFQMPCPCPILTSSSALGWVWQISPTPNNSSACHIGQYFPPDPREEQEQPSVSFSSYYWQPGHLSSLVNRSLNFSYVDMFIDKCCFHQKSLFCLVCPLLLSVIDPAAQKMVKLIDPEQSWKMVSGVKEFCHF